MSDDAGKNPLVLVIEDEIDIAELISYNLVKAGFKVEKAGDAKTAFSTIQRQTPDLILLDLMLPDANGTDVCKTLQAGDKTGHIPIIMVTAKSEEIDRVLGLELGADDYIVKPFSPRELVLRAKAVLKRVSVFKPEAKKLSAHEIQMDLDKHVVLVGGGPVSLTITEFNLLHSLMKNKGRVLTRELLLDQVWGYHFEGYARTVDTHIKRLRQKLNEAGQHIETVRGLGYRFKEESDLETV